MRTALAIALLALPLLAPAGQAGFTDPLPGLSAAATAAASAPGLNVAGHAQGQVLGLDPDTGANRWSAGVSGGVADLAVFGELVLAAHARSVSALRLSDGGLAWRHDASSPATALAAAAGQAWVGLEDGRALRLAADGAVAEERDLGLDGLTDLDVLDGRLAAAAVDGLVLQSPAGTLRQAGTFRNVRWTGSDSALAVDGTGRLQAVDATAAGLSLVAAPSGLQGVTALDRDGPSAVAGDADGLLHALGLDGAATQPPLATYANAVLDVDLAGDVAVAAFRGGWLGALRLDRAPVALLLSPAERDWVPNPFTVSWAYSDPDAQPGDSVRHRVQVRLPGSPWQIVATGHSAADPLTRLRTQVVDLAIPSGTAFELRLELSDKDGHMRMTTLGAPVTIDADPPEVAGQSVPAPGQRVTTPRPTIGFGHRDRHSGVQGADTQLLLDGEPGRVDWESVPAFTTMKPTADLAEGPHTWQASVFDRAGNRLVLGGHFIVDTQPPTPGVPAIEALADALLLSFTTPEPAACFAEAGGRTSPTGGEAMTHVLAVTGLAPDTAYTVRVTCRDPSGTTSFRDAAARTAGQAATGSAVSLDVDVLPADPQGAGGFHTTAPVLRARVEPTTATLQWSVGGAAFTPLPDPATLPDGRHNVVVLARAADGASSVRMLRVDVDTSPPSAPVASLDLEARVLAWQPVADPHSGIVSVRTEALVDGAWLLLHDLPAGVREASGIPAAASQVRVVARNGAGLEAASAPMTLPARAGDALHTTAALVQPSVGPQDRVLVRVRLGEGDAVRDVTLTNANGVQRRFTDHVEVAPRLRQYAAPASAFRAGEYDVAVRLTDGESVPVGKLTVQVDGNGTSDGGQATAQASRDSPAPAAALAALAAVALAAARRRR